MSNSLAVLEDQESQKTEENILQKFEGIQQKLVKLLGSGAISQEQAALAVGVDASYVSQCLAEKEFNDAVIQIRYLRLQSASELDKIYDRLEHVLAEKLTDQLTYLVRPTDILNALSRINAFKRRGSGLVSAPSTTNVVQFILPSIIKQKFVTNIHNQVIQAGDQSLTTIASNVLLKEFENVQGVIDQKVLPRTL